VLFQTNIQQGMSASFVVMMIFLILLLVAAVIFSFVFWILMIVDCAKRKHLSDGERIAWILVLVFLGIIGALIYYLAIKRK
jgi:NADH:ubiquinone oxidoreductase subunit 6 (subunit J)